MTMFEVHDDGRKLEVGEIGQRLDEEYKEIDGVYVLDGGDIVVKVDGRLEVLANDKEVKQEVEEVFEWELIEVEEHGN